MTCKELVEFLDDYIAGAVSPAARDAFEHHLAECQPCRAYLASYRSTIELAKQFGGRPQADVSQMPEELVQAILAARGNAGSSH